MSTFNFSGQINGQVQAGDSNVMQVSQTSSGAGATQSTGGQETALSALQLASMLVDLVRVEAPGVQTQAETVRGELARAEEEGVDPNRGRIRRLLDTITAGVGAGSGALALVQGIGQAIGG